VQVNSERIKKDIETINNFNLTHDKGVTRLSFTPEYMKAYHYVIEEMKKIGAEVSICRAGCIRGRLPGSDPHQPAVMTGSHIDTVINGGQFDGQVGTVSALETARAIVDNNVPHSHPIDVVVFTEEEGARFRMPLAGSSAWSGSLEAEKVYQATDQEGVTFAQAMTQAGLTPDDDSPLRPGEIKNMLEIHIEQSVVLDREGVSVGVVESIAGLRWFKVTIEGVADHAGGTPMNYRHDALQGAVRVIAAVEEIAANEMGPHTVGTVGFIKLEPGSTNVIPGRAEFTLDLRDAEAENIEVMPSKIEEVIKEVCSSRGLTYHMEPQIAVSPVKIDLNLVDMLKAKTKDRGIDALGMMSGALHDSCKLVDLTTVGMLFVPSKNGLSHCPEEWTDLKDIENGANILLDAIIELSR